MSVFKVTVSVPALSPPSRRRASGDSRLGSKPQRQGCPALRGSRRKAAWLWAGPGPHGRGPSCWAPAGLWGRRTRGRAARAWQSSFSRDGGPLPWSFRARGPPAHVHFARMKQGGQWGAWSVAPPARNSPAPQSKSGPSSVSHCSPAHLSSSTKQSLFCEGSFRNALLSGSFL